MGEREKRDPGTSQSVERERGEIPFDTGAGDNETIAIFKERDSSYIPLAYYLLMFQPLFGMNSFPMPFMREVVRPWDCAKGQSLCAINKDFNTISSSLSLLMLLLRASFSLLYTSTFA